VDICLSLRVGQLLPVAHVILFLAGEKTSASLQLISSSAASDGALQI
jgi:hypothetical protein